MAVNLFLWKGMIDCFHSCAKKADYQQLFNDYSTFFDELIENLVKLKYEPSDKDMFCQDITKNSKHLLNILRQWHCSGPSFCKELLELENIYPKFMAHFREFGSVKDWNQFYTTFKWTADVIITRARNEKVLDFKIECKVFIFDSFERRDKFLKHCEKRKNELMSQMREELEMRGVKREEEGKKLMNEMMELLAGQTVQMEHRIRETNEKMSQIKDQLKLSETKHKEDGQTLKKELVGFYEKKREQDEQKLRNEMMKRFESQAQQMENRISETNEKMESMNRKLAHFNSSFNEKYSSLGEQFNSMQLDKNMEALNIQKNNERSRAKLEEDGQKLKNELMERFASQTQQMEKRISETNEKIESMNRKLAHFNSSFNEKYSSLGEQFNSMQLDKKIEAISIQNNGGEALNQFLAKTGERFSEQMIEMNKKMERMIEMMKQNGGKSSGEEE